VLSDRRGPAHAVVAPAPLHPRERAPGRRRDLRGRQGAGAPGRMVSLGDPRNEWAHAQTSAGRAGRVLGAADAAAPPGGLRATTMDSQTTTKALGRLRRIEGQVQGIQRMVEEDKSCVDVLLQLAAVQGAVEQVQKLLLGKHLEACVAEAVRTPSTRDRQRKMDELLDVFSRFSGR